MSRFGSFGFSSATVQYSLFFKLAAWQTEHQTSQAVGLFVDVNAFKKAKERKC